MSVRGSGIPVAGANKQETLGERRVASGHCRALTTRAIAILPPGSEVTSPEWPVNSTKQARRKTQRRTDDLREKIAGVEGVQVLGERWA